MKINKDQTNQSMASATVNLAGDELAIFLSGEIVPYIITIHSITGTTIAGYLLLNGKDLACAPRSDPPYPDGYRHHSG